jgi:hypothetical protein
MPPAIPESTKTSLGQRLRQRQRQRWPGLAGVAVRFGGRFAYVDGGLHTGEVLPLCRLRYSGSASLWGFAVYMASRDGYEDSVLPIGEPEEALDCACGLYLNDPKPGRSTSHRPAPDHARTSIHQYLAPTLGWMG